MIMFTESKYSRSWLRCLMCLNNHGHTLENVNFQILLWICFSVVKSIVNITFLDFFFALRNVLYLFYLFGLLTKVSQVPHPLQNQQVLNQKVLESISFFFTECSFLVCRWTSIENFIVMGFSFICVLFTSSLPEICSQRTSEMSQEFREGNKTMILAVMNAIFAIAYGSL